MDQGLGHLTTCQSYNFSYSGNSRYKASSKSGQFETNSFSADIYSILRTCWKELSIKIPFQPLQGRFIRK